MAESSKIDLVDLVLRIEQRGAPHKGRDDKKICYIFFGL